MTYMGVKCVTPITIQFLALVGLIEKTGETIPSKAKSLDGAACTAETSELGKNV